jgi:hypothetical protein
VRTRSIAELWNGGEQNERRGKHLTGRKGENELCANCTVWNDPSDRANVSEAFVAVME